MKTEIENETGFQNETQTSFQNENEPVIWIENENELQNEIEMKNRFENELQNENENETQNELQNGFQNELNSQNELEKPTQNELKALQDYNERFNRENCIELLWEHFREQHNLKPVPNSWAKKDLPNGFITAQSYQTDYNVFYVEKTWFIGDGEKILDKKMIDLRITKIKGE